MTNFVLMEFGQPMHAFDRARLAGERVVVRRAAAGEPMTLLDDTEIELCEDDLVIADASSPQALAGIMGGQGSMVEADTRALLLEVAFFEPLAIRRSARRYGLHTDSSYRFERQVDYGAQLEQAAGRALALLHELCGVTCVGRQDARGALVQPPIIELDPDHVRRLLGMHVEASTSARILAGLGIDLDRDRVPWRCTPPSFRPDLTRAVDLIEEVMRHNGLDELPAVFSISPEQPQLLPVDRVRTLADALSDGLRARGLHEHVGLAFIAEDGAEALAAGEAASVVRLVNPMRSQQACMRPHLLPGLLEAVDHNVARHARPLALFEVGRVYAWPDERPASSGDATSAVDPYLPREPYRAGVLRASTVVTSTGALAREVTSDLLATLARLGLRAEARRPAEARAWLHPGIQVELWVGDRVVGVAGELHPDRVAERERELELAYAELWLETLPEAPVAQFQDIARYPATTRDLSLDLDDAVSAAQAVAALADAAATAASAAGASAGEDPPRLASADEPRRPIAQIEDYRGAGVDPGRHALLLRLSYRARQRTVTDDEVQPLHDAIVAGALEALRRVDPQARPR